MTTSKTTHYKEAFVWIWLPGHVEPVVAGKLSSDGQTIAFNYGKSYLARDDAIPLYRPELPLRPGLTAPLPGLSMPGCIRDGAPDAWGRRVLINRKLGRAGAGTDSAELDELTYLLESGSDRIGALDFQHSPTEYVPRSPVNASLDELLESARRVESGELLTPELDRALHHGSSIGGARPKASIEAGNKKFVAKFSSSSDLYNIVKAEFIAMRLAHLAGLDVAPVSLVQASGRDVLLIERFDRLHTEQGWQRKCMVSALTLFALDELMARYASYESFAEMIRHYFMNPAQTLAQLFSRLVFNILCGNTDDHARNHAAFWDGKTLTLTPAYEICPQGRAGQEASQAMLITADQRMSRISLCIKAAPQFHLTDSDALKIVEHQVASITRHFDAVCDEAALAPADRLLLWRRQFLNPFAFQDLPAEIKGRLMP